jgi:hypothetical protein
VEDLRHVYQPSQPRFAKGLAILTSSLILCIADLVFILNQAIAHNAPPIPLWIPLPTLLVAVLAFNYFLTARRLKASLKIRGVAIASMILCALGLFLLFIDWIEDPHNVTPLWPPKHDSILNMRGDYHAKLQIVRRNRRIAVSQIEPALCEL